MEQRQACLAWLVEGAVKYHTDEGAKRFKDVPQVVRATTKAWRAEADQIMLYIETFLIFDPTRAVRPEDLRNHYNSWAIGRNQQPLSPQKFNGRFAGHALITSHNVERNKPMRTNTLLRMISYPPGAMALDGQAKIHKVWVGFRYREPADDVNDAGGQYGTNSGYTVFPGQERL